MKNHYFLVLCVFFSISINSVFGSVTGKISGKITDSQTGESLPGANVILKGWSGNKITELERPMGAASDTVGEYFIINIPPGKYAIIAKMMGYKQLRYTDVLVSMGRTIVVNFALQQETIKGQEVTIVAKREVVQADVSASQMILNTKETENLPRNTIQEVLALSPGVSINNYDNKIDIRGGGNDQVMAYLDGFAMKDNTFNRPFLSYNRTAIEEITIQTGGFQAEYGELRSGLINVVTKEGGTDYNFSLDWKYSPAGYRYDGPKKYIEDKYYLMYGSDWSMNEKILREKFPNPEDKFIGWPKISEQKYEDSDSTNDMTPNQRRQLWLWRHRGRPEGEKPDNIIDVTFDGPLPGADLPGIGTFLSKLSFLVSYRGDYTAYAHPGARDHFQERNLMYKLRYNISNSTKLSFLGMDSDTWGLGFMDATRAYEPNVMRTGGGGSYVTQNNHLAVSKMSTIGMRFEQIISPSTFLEIRFSHSNNKFNFDHGALRDTTKIKKIAAEYYTLQSDTLHAPGIWDSTTGHYIVGDTTLYKGDKIWCPASFWDETPDGWVYPGVTSNDDQVGRVDFDAMTNDVDHSLGSNTLFRGDITSQVNKYHLLKAGFYFSESAMERDYYQIREYAQKYTEAEGGGEDIAISFREVPRYGALYLQDRIEIKGLVGNFGLRGEYFDANSKSYMPNDPFSNFYFITNYWQNVQRMDYKRSKVYYRLSPRFGISNPMTANSKIYFNYGHAYTAPDNIFRYGFKTHPRMWSNLQWRGNPDLQPPKTVQYSLGYEQVLFNNYLIHSEIYYKDVTDELGDVYYQNVFSDNPTQRYYTWDNKKYEDIIGWEFRLYKRLGRFFTGWLQTEFRGQKAGEIGYKTRFVKGDPQNVSEFSKILWPDDFLWQWTPSFIANIDLHTPNNWGPRVLGHPIFGGLRINGIINWAEGNKWTWNPDNSPFIYNNMQNANYFRGDFYISKNLMLKGVNANLYLDVRNLFSRKLLNWQVLSGPNDRPGKEQYEYLKSIEKSKHRVGHYKAHDIVRPAEKPGDNYFARVGGPIRIYFGLRFNFTR
ncbi:MAG: TonB-dependent receptor plug domain-containing protein [Actinobacteria bacterium]|nr:TonB-dependent receptor plug domain-containing protein [Actinomycetota bacterium]